MWSFVAKIGIDMDQLHIYICYFATRKIEASKLPVIFELKIEHIFQINETYYISILTNCLNTQGYS